MKLVKVNNEDTKAMLLGKIEGKQKCIMFDRALNTPLSGA